ncbi:MAG: valine--tRNA ligase [Holophagales bacterium]|nr:valine--tRNA ligase [Holophagales bacterium]
MTEMEKRFDPKAYEGRWQRAWADGEYFVCPAPSDRPPYCVMIPPPNVTGKLHMGHALQSTLQDVLTRWRRMQGYNALWLPGTDHAGIATQLMVERELASEGLTRHDLGRERFLERMWRWKGQYHGNIRRQLDRLGASCDWTRERFTLDEGLSRAVREAFVRLHGEGLIYRGEYIVNWSTGLDTAISDLEVEMRSVEDHLWHVAYPVEGSDERIVVATTRPETMLGDTAIAFHPEDERYARLAGRRALVPIAGRSIPFVADEIVERDFGSGLVKVTPAHDPADFEIGRRHELPSLPVIDRHGRMTPAAGEEFAGLTVDEAREKLLARLRAEGFLVREEKFVHNVGFCQRSGVRVQPLVSTQWFCDVSGMAGQALAAVGDGRLELVPASWGKTWEHWLSNIRPWCISRQLWWGHQIPAWYDADGRCFVAHTFEEAAAAAGTEALRQDPDVLDTWFSSALWPFSTLGWPDETVDLATFYPTSVLVTGFDILFFWVARMVMTGLHFTGESPFARVHLTGLVRDAEGQKMSKTKGNVLDPEDLVEEYGADAVRFTLALLDSPGRDIPLDAERMSGYRAFGNKIWNATRFALSRTAGAELLAELPTDGLALPERWILGRVSEAAERVSAHFEEFRFDLACDELYHFFWSDFCDWYLEMAKPGLDAATARPAVGEVTLTVLDRALRLLHPVMPFLSEELWQRLPGHETIHPETICLAPYPAAEPGWRLADEDAEAIDLVRRVVTTVRNDRAELKVPAKASATLAIEIGDAGGAPAAELLASAEIAPLLASLCGVTSVRLEAAPPSAPNKHPIGGLVVTPLFASAGDRVDVERLRAQLEEVEGALARARARLDNPSFVEKAPEAVVDGARRAVDELSRKREHLIESLEVASR